MLESLVCITVVMSEHVLDLMVDGKASNERHNSLVSSKIRY